MKTVLSHKNGNVKSIFKKNGIKIYKRNAEILKAEFRFKTEKNHVCGSGRFDIQCSEWVLIFQKKSNKVV